MVCIQHPKCAKAFFCCNARRLHRESVIPFTASGILRPQSKWAGKPFGLESHSLVIQSVPQNATRQGSRMLSIFEQHLTIDYCVMDATSELPEAPITGRKIVHYFFRQRADGVRIENCDVGR